MLVLAYLHFDLHFSEAHTLNISLHTAGALLLHLLRDMTVNVQCKSGGVVAQVFLYRFGVIPILQGEGGVGMAQVVDCGVRCAYLSVRIRHFDELKAAIELATD